MDNSKSLIRSSIVSIIIVIFGLFLLCVSRAPKINTDESANTDNEEQALLNLLTEAGDEMQFDDSDLESLMDENNQTETSGDNNDDLAFLLNEGEESFNGDMAEENQGDMEDLMSLLQTEENDQAQSPDQDFFAANETKSEFSQNEYNEAPTTNENSNDQSTEPLSNIQDEINYLENVLQDKNSEKDLLQSQLDNYNQRIAELENQSSSPGNSQFSMQQVDYGEAGSSDYNSDNSGYNASMTAAIDDFEITYQDALRLFHQHKYNEAKEQFFQLLQINTRHRLADNCQYWIGECCFAQGRYYQAIAEFNKVTAFDATDKKDDSQMMLGLSYMKLGETHHARNELDWLVSTFASSEYLMKANHFLNRL